MQFYGEETLNYGSDPSVGDTYTVNVQPSCTQSDQQVSPQETEHCTLVISSFVIRPPTLGTTTTVCEIPLPEVSTSLPSGEFADKNHKLFVCTVVISYSYFIQTSTNLHCQ